MCEDRVVSYEDAKKLPYLQACIKEALRVFHPVSMGTPRVVPKGGITIGEQTFPAGTTLSLNTFSMNLSQDLWGPDAREFKPERWMAEDTAAMEKLFIPVSGCPGPRFRRADKVIVLGWNRLLCRSASGENRVVQDSRNYRARLRYTTSQPRPGMELRCLLHGGSRRLASLYREAKDVI